MAMEKSVIIVPHPHGKKTYDYPVWEVRWSERDPNGQAARKTSWHKSRKEADAFAAEKRRALKSHGDEHAGVSKPELAALIRFREWRKLNPDAPDLPAVVEQAIASFESTRSTITVSEAIDLRLTSAEKRELSGRHLSDLRTRLARFANAFKNRALTSITTEELDSWLHSLDVQPVTWGNYQRAIGSVFKLALKRGEISKNPAEALDVPKITRNAPAILEPAQARALLSAASPSILPLLVLQSFCGVRRAEAERLSWSNLRLDDSEPFVELPSTATKTNRRRNPPIPDNARAWLIGVRGMQDATLGISQETYRRHLRAAAKSAGIVWEENLLRHSFGTYRLAITKNAAQVAEEMGNSTAVVRGHYQNVTSPEAARQWFAIFPDNPAPAQTAATPGRPLDESEDGP
jgi:integrase